VVVGEWYAMAATQGGAHHLAFWQQNSRVVRSDSAARTEGAAAAGVEPAAPPVQEEALRAEQLRIMKRRATGLLLAITAAFLVVVLLGDDSGWMGYLRAAAEGSMVGGLADWFAVTAIFRHPLGLPIPHTAVIPERKEQFGATLGAFVSDNFLSPDVISERLKANRVVPRTGAWLADRANAETAARHAAEVVVGVADVVRDEEVHELVDSQLERAVAALPVSVLAGRALRTMTAEGRHHELFDSMLRGLERFLQDNRASFRERFGRESPRWLPNAVEDRIFERLYDGVQRMLTDANSDPNHEVRAQFNAYVASLVDRLETAPEMRERGDQLKRELLAHPALREWTGGLWTDVKAALRTQASDPQSELRRRLADAVVTAGQRLCDDPELAQKAEEMLESGARYVTTHFHDEIAGLVSGTIARWDGEETARKLELLLGRDLQFIRINGTVVGGLAGLLIHAAAEAFG
jgi:uncharacterized membrane-anchored protein YjiN (DUF445 family)